jgi:Fe-S oxidoreductase
MPHAGIRHAGERQKEPRMDLPRQDRPENDCILCGRCMEVCPVLGCTGREELGPRAKGLMARRLKESPGELSLDKVKALASLCAGCDRCRSVCPAVDRHPRSNVGNQAGLP